MKLAPLAVSVALLSRGDSFFINEAVVDVMQDLLRELFESLGFSGVATFIASGNVAFNTGERQDARKEDREETARGFWGMTWLCSLGRMRT